MKESSSTSLNVPDNFDETLENNNDYRELSYWKRKVFSFLYTFIPKGYFNPTVCSWIIVISFLQTLSLMIQNNDDLDNKMAYLSILRLYPAIESTQSEFIYFVALYLLSSLVLLFIFLIAMAKSVSNGFLINYVSHFIVPLYWVLLIPITEFFLSLFRCNSSGNNVANPMLICWSINHYIHISCTVVPLISWFCILAFITLQNSFPHHHEFNPFAHYPWNFEVIYTICRVIFLINAWPLFSGQLCAYIAGALCFLASIYFISLIWDIFPYYNSTVSLYFSGSVLIVVLGNCIHWGVFALGNYFPNINHDEIILQICSVIFIFAFMNILQRKRRLQLFLKKKPENPEDIDMQIHLLVQSQIYMNDTEFVSNLYLEGFFRSLEETFNYGKLELTKENNGKNINNLIINLFKYEEENGLKDNRMNLQLARLYLSLQENVYLTYSKIAEFDDLETNFVLQFAIFCLKKDIAEEINIKSRQLSKRGQGNFIKVLMYEHLSLILKNTLIYNAQVWLDFWTLLKDQPDLNKLHRLGLDIIKKDSAVSRIKLELSAICPYHYGTLIMLAQYYTKVLGQAKESDLIENKINKMSLEKTGESSSFNLYSDKSTSIIVAGDPHHLGKIVKASANISHIFGYDQEYLVSKNIGILMPKFLKNAHNRHIKKKLAYTPAKWFGNQMICFGMHKDGYIIPIKTTIQQYFTLKKGLLYITNIQLIDEISSENYILTNYEGKIVGVTRDLGDFLQITPTTIQENSVFIESVCPDLENTSVYSTVGLHKLQFNMLDQTSKEGDIYNTNEPVTFKHQPKSYLARIKAKCEINNLEYFDKTKLLKMFKVPFKSGVKLEKPRSKDLSKCKNIAFQIETRKAIVTQKSKKFEKTMMKDIQSNGNTNILENAKNNIYMGQSYTTQGAVNNADEGIKYNTSISEMLPNEEMQVDKEISVVSVKAKNDSLKQQKDNTFVNKGKKKLINKTEWNEVANEIEKMRKLRYDNFFPVAVIRIKYTLVAFMIILFAAITVRLAIALLLNGKYGGYSQLLVANANRLKASGLIIKYIWNLILMQKRINNGPPLLDQLSRKPFVDYKSYLLGEDNDNITTYRDFCIRKLEILGDTLKTSEAYLINGLNSLDQANQEIVNPESIPFTIKTSAQNVTTYLMSYDTGIVTNLDYLYQFLDMVRKGTELNENNIVENYILTNTLTSIVIYGKKGRDGILFDTQQNLNLQDTVSFWMLMCIVIILAILIIALLPLLLIINKELAMMLSLLIQISSNDIKKCTSNIISFLEITRLHAKDNSGFNRNSHILEDNENEEESKTIKKEAQVDRKSTNAAYIPHSNNTLLIMILISTFSATIIACYIAYDTLTKSMGNSISYQTEELNRTTRNYYFNYFASAYPYQMFATNNTGKCTGSICSVYLTAAYPVRVEEINDLLISHKATENLMANTYNVLFHNLIEGNPCETTDSFGNFPNCSTLGGGQIPLGGYIGLLRYLDTQNTLTNDFSRIKATWGDIASYINDPRLINYELQSELFVSPALEQLSLELMKDINDSRENYETMAIGGYIIYVLLLFCIGIIGSIFLLEYMRKSSYDTNSLLSNLPSDVIHSTEEIKQFVLNSMKKSTID